MRPGPNVVAPWSNSANSYPYVAAFNWIACLLESSWRAVVCSLFLDTCYVSLDVKTSSHKARRSESSSGKKVADGGPRFGRSLADLASLTLPSVQALLSGHAIHVGITSFEYLDTMALNQFRLYNYIIFLNWFVA